MKEVDSLKDETAEEQGGLKNEAVKEQSEVKNETVDNPREIKSEVKETKKVEADLEKRANVTAGLLISNMVLGVIYSIFLIATLAGGLAGGLAGTATSIANILLGLGGAAMAFTVIVSIAASIISLVAFILHIIITVEYGQRREKNAVIFALLIVGFFIGIVAIISLFMLASEEKKNKAKA